MSLLNNPKPYYFESQLSICWRDVALCYASCRHYGPYEKGKTWTNNIFYISSSQVCVGGGMQTIQHIHKNNATNWIHWYNKASTSVVLTRGGHHNYDGDVNDVGERGLDGLTTKDRCNKKGSNEKGLGKAKVMEGHFSTSSYKEPLLKAFGHELKILCTKRSNKRGTLVSVHTKNQY